jgi:hypothetical protein
MSTVQKSVSAKSRRPRRDVLAIDDGSSGAYRVFAEPADMLRHIDEIGGRQA